MWSAVFVGVVFGEVGDEVFDVAESGVSVSMYVCEGECVYVLDSVCDPTEVRSVAGERLIFVLLLSTEDLICFVVTDGGG